MRLSQLSPRLSANLEDALLSRLNDADVRLLLVDPILGKSITKGGLDWLRSVSVPSSSLSFLRNDGNGNNDVDGIDDDMDSITVTIRPPTLLHPRLNEVASKVVDVVREVTLSWIANRRMNDTTSGIGWNDSFGEVRPEGIGVTIHIVPKSTSMKSTTLPNNDSSASLSINNAATLRNISHFLAVYSCKGGVGKSTIAVNLAYRLAAMGGRVGLVDLDVYGPSLPLLVRPDDPTVRRSLSSTEYGPNTVDPIEHRGVKLMSLGYVSPNSGVPGSGPGGGAAVMRGPMAGRVVSQLLNGTNWGQLDVLVLDLPPGTGDVQLEVCQCLSLSGAVAVSTPSALAWADVHKGVKMFDDLGVRTLAVVENMAYFVCEGGGRHYPFGKSREVWGNNNESLPGPSRVFRLPVSSEVHDSNESGSPLCCDGDLGSSMGTTTSADDDDGAAGIFSKLAHAISTDLLLLDHGMTPPVSGTASTTSAVMIDETGDSVFDVPFTRLSVDNTHKKFTVRLFSDGGGYQKVISGHALRCRDPRTGEEVKGMTETPAVRGSSCGGGGQSAPSSLVVHNVIVHVESSATAKDGLFPARVTRKGNYGYEVEWADGAKVIYSLLAIAKAVGGKPLNSSDSGEQ